MEDVRNQKSWSERQPSVEEGDEQKDEVEEEQDITLAKDMLLQTIKY